MTRHAIVGLFFLLSIVLLGLVTLKVTDLSEVLGETPRGFEVEFPGSVIGLDGQMRGGVSGLERGDDVLVSGVKVGRVERVELVQRDAALDPSRPDAKTPQFRVRVQIRLHQAVQLRGGYRVRITDASLLGGKRIEIDPGVGEPTADTRLIGSLQVSPLEALGHLIDQNRANIDQTFSDIRAITGQITRGQGTIGALVMRSDVHDRINGIVERVERIAATVESGGGIVQGLLYNEQLRADVQTFVREARAVAEELQQGRGTLGRLFKQEDIYNDLRETVATGRRLVDEVAAGKGLVGRLFASPDMAAKLDRFANALVDPATTLGRLVYDQALGAEIAQTVGDVREIVAHVRAGKGAVGRLLMEDDVVERLKAALTALAGTIEEARESAPVNAFLTTLFRWW